MILDHHGIQPNPARDRRVKLPREEKQELTPPSASDVLAVHELLPSRYRLPLLGLDATGMRVGELETLTCVDEVGVREAADASRQLEEHKSTSPVPNEAPEESAEARAARTP